MLLRGSDKAPDAVGDAARVAADAEQRVISCGGVALPERLPPPLAMGLLWTLPLQIAPLLARDARGMRLS